MHGALVDYEGTNLKIEEFKKLRMTTKIKARVPFKEFVPHKKRNGEMVEDLKKSDWLTVDIRLPDIPPHVQRQARLLYAQTPPEYLVGSVKVNSYITTWGKRLIAR
jgi:hypothetical protein